MKICDNIKMMWIYMKKTIHLERFFRNLLMGEDNVLMNRHLHIKAKELLVGVAPSSNSFALI